MQTLKRNTAAVKKTGAKASAKKAQEPTASIYEKVGENLSAKFNAERNVLYLRIDLEKAGELSQKGTCLVVSKSSGFVSLAKICKGDEVGLNMIVTRRKAKKAVATEEAED